MTFWSILTSDASKMSYFARTSRPPADYYHLVGQKSASGTILSLASGLIFELKLLVNVVQGIKYVDFL